MSILTGATLPAATPVITPSASYWPVPSVSVKLPVPFEAARSSINAERALCAVASLVTETLEVRLPTRAPLIAEADTALLELTGCVWSVPPDDRPPSAVEKVVIVFLSVLVAEICVVSVLFFAASAAVLAANCAWTSWVTSDAVSMPEPELSEVSSCCVADLTTLLVVAVALVAVGVGVLVVAVVVVIVELRALHPSKRPEPPDV